MVNASTMPEIENMACKKDLCECLKTHVRKDGAC